MPKLLTSWPVVMGIRIPEYSREGNQEKVRKKFWLGYLAWNKKRGGWDNKKRGGWDNTVSDFIRQAIHEKIDRQGKKGEVDD